MERLRTGLGGSGSEGEAGSGKVPRDERGWACLSLVGPKGRRVVRRHVRDLILPAGLSPWCLSQRLGSTVPEAFVGFGMLQDQQSETSSGDGVF